MDLYMTVSIILLLGSMIATMIGLTRVYIQQKRQQQQEQKEQQEEQEQQEQQQQQQQQEQENISSTTLARHQFEYAEANLACTKELYKRLETTNNYIVIDEAMNQLDTAAKRWAHALAHVLQTKRRARSPSPASRDLYERFMPSITK